MNNDRRNKRRSQPANYMFKNTRMRRLLFKSLFLNKKFTHGTGIRSFSTKHPFSTLATIFPPYFSTVWRILFTPYP